jgi:dienelactone hydrolase
MDSSNSRHYRLLVNQRNIDMRSTRTIPLCFAIVVARLVIATSLTTAEERRPATASDTAIVSPPDHLAPQQRYRGNRNSDNIYRHRITPNWVGDNTKFWYRNDLADGAREFVFVDATAGTRQPAFDHVAVATALGNQTQPTHLPVDALEYNAEGTLMALRINGKRYSWDAAAVALTEIETDSAHAATANSNNVPPASAQTGADTSITFINKLTGPAEIFWLAGDGTKTSYGKIDAGSRRDQHTFGGHRWEIFNDKNESLGEVVANDAPTEIIIDGSKYAPPRRARRRERGGRGNGNPEQFSGRSPDGKWIAAIEQHNVVIRSTETEESIPLSSDGKEGLSYSRPIWSPDSQSLVAFRVEEVDRKLVHLVRSSPEQGGRAELESRPYVLPGDPFPTYELNVFSVESRQQRKPEVDRFEHEWLRPEVRFIDDGKKFCYEQIDRGHQRFRLIEVNIADGTVRNLIDEQTDTFIWTAHTENHGVPVVTWLESNQEIIYATEKNGWRQLILVDVKTGNEIRELTPRGIVVRGLDRVDETNRRVWFSASGRENQDPYLIHYAYVDLDTGHLTWLTDGHGNHSIEFSPDGQYLIDNYSRVDMAPVHELRRVADGQLVCHLETADTSELEAHGWSAPEVFVAKGRDGETDIWGIICRPRNFDPNHKYPVIEDIYAGPQGSFVPKSFSPGDRYDSLTSLGFIVVKIDGMGTANRSKAFHDVCWKNLKDGGFADRILWIQAAAAKYPELDLSRVGIYGTSAGGQNAAAAVLFHPEFYKVAVAACGCHDNRMDKASWNEQWMGYPVESHYSECSNIDNAHRLQGKLLLIVGEMDNNVPPESTLRFADALIRANKDFDLLVVPNAGHGMGGGYGQRRMHDYFVRHLLGAEPPDRNASADPRDPGTVPTSVAKSADDLQITAPPAEFFQLVPERDRQAAREFYSKYLDVGGLPVVAADVVADEALLQTHTIVTHMLAGRPDILAEMKNTGMYLIIIGKDQVYTDMPEYRDHPNPDFQNERVRGTGGKPTSFGEENLLSVALDRYDDESIAVHEFCHTIDGALRSMDRSWSDRVRDTYRDARRKGLYEGAYAGSNPGEYWAEICQAYFDCNRVNNWNHGPVGTREQLKAYDPVGYELVRSTFQLAPDQDWRYTFPRKLPAVETPPAKLKIDPYYTKFSWAREFTVVGREASDEAILRANDVVRKMFAYRHDLLKALIADDVKLVVLGPNEHLRDLPELQTLSATDNIDLLARSLEYSPATKLLVVSEEHVMGDPRDVQVGDSQLISVLAGAVHQVAGMRAEDPAWEDRPRHIWQQYELRVKRLDIHFHERLTKLHEQALAAGKWQGTAAVHSPENYWKAGVLAYFDAAGQHATPTDSARAIETREQLRDYDPDLYALVNETMAYDHRVDWRLKMSR